MAKIGIKLKQGMGIEEKKNGTEPINWKKTQSYHNLIKQPLF